MTNPTDERRALVIDDEESIRFFLERTLAKSGWTVTTADDGESGVAAFESTKPHLVITDLKMPKLDGIGVLERIKQIDGDVPVVMVTGFGSIDTAVEAMKRGAADYLTKPFDVKTIRAVIQRLAGRPTASPAAAPRLVGDGKKMTDLRERIDRIADSEAIVLLRGESGTGKEVVARVIHAGSPRAAGPFVAIHCAALPPQLLEAQLFGHEQGAFTGASRAHQGYAARAAGGTLLLDEVGDIPLPLQAKLLRVLQEREFTPLGSGTPRPLEARIIAATHRDLNQMVEVGDFREDLLYRLDVVRLEVPPLRARREDIPSLVEHFIGLAPGADAPRFTTEALDALGRYGWPGNVRELHNLVERFAALKPGADVAVDDLPPEIQGAHQREVETSSGSLPFEAARDAFERDYFERLLAETDGNVSEAARRAGISRPNLYRRLDRLGLERT